MNMEITLLEDEKTYPIYWFEAEYIMDGMDAPEIHGTSVMLGPDETPETTLRRIWASFISHEISAGENKGRTRAELNCKLSNLNSRFVKDETWCLDWFSHYTYNWHLNDGALFASFESYCRRCEQENRNNGHFFDGLSDNGKPFICLMGAEDRWRWEGPCRCDGCQSKGIVRFDH